jgi:hypothetical protein
MKANAFEAENWEVNQDVDGAREPRSRAARLGSPDGAIDDGQENHPRELKEADAAAVRGPVSVTRSGAGAIHLRDVGGGLDDW